VFGSALQGQPFQGRHRERKPKREWRQGLEAYVSAIRLYMDLLFKHNTVLKQAELPCGEGAAA
ncbi:MAG: hypothetical protein ACRELF_21905, partial [Gemmataceae bacterium]